MKHLFPLLLFSLIMLLPIKISAETKDEVPPVQINWDKKEDDDRSQSYMPSLLRDINHVYVYSEKQLDNLSIGITDMMGNTYYYEVTNVPACTYYAVSIASLPTGQYYLCVYQGSNYIIGMFTKD